MKGGYSERPKTASVELVLLLSFIRKHVWASLVPEAEPGAMNTKINKHFLSGVSRFLKGSHLWWPSEPSTSQAYNKPSTSAQKMLQLGTRRRQKFGKGLHPVLNQVLRAEFPSRVE